MRFSPLLEHLITALRHLPGVGQKTAQRMAIHLLTRKREQARALATILITALDNMMHCQHCRILSENQDCEICLAKHRDATLLCIVENPIDVLVIEQTASFKGKYFILFGHLSPLDGIGPEDIGMPQLKIRLQQENIQEIIIATNPTVEGEATAHYIATLAKPWTKKITRIARGVGIGSELEYIDANTLAHALVGREEIVNA